MQTRPNFHALRRTLESSLLSPSSRDAVERLAGFVPRRTGPTAEVLGCVLFVDSSIWRFRSPSETKKFAEQLETYFRNFDQTYRITSLEESAASDSEARVSFR